MERRSLADIASTSWPSNKPPYYLGIYEQYLGSLRDQTVAVLELGVHRGGSLQMWGTYFPFGTVVGLDMKPPFALKPDGRVIMDGKEARIRGFEGEHIHFVLGQQDDAELLSLISDKHAPRGWDVVIDDCSHVGALTRASFLALFPRVRRGGYYVIEDWATGYWDEWSDGVRFDRNQHLTVRGTNYFPSHPFGLPGFLKQLVDELAMDDITRPNQDNGASTRPMFESVHLYKGLCIVRR